MFYSSLSRTKTSPAKSVCNRQTNMQTVIACNEAQKLNGDIKAREIKENSWRNC